MMGGSTGNLGGILLSFLLAVFMGLLGAVIMGVLGQMGWWAAGGLGVALAAGLSLFFVVVLGGPTERFDGRANGGMAGSFAAQMPQARVAAAAPVKSAAPARVMDAPAPAAAVAAPAAMPVAAKAMAPVDDSAIAAAGEGTKPVGLSGPRGGKGDDLKTIEGIGPVLEKLCHDMGIFHFDQIAGWGAPEVAWMNGNLKGFKGRVGRDKWVAQARLIGSVGIEEFKRRAETNDY
jgi:predicted flap endonuclease-1-like 5' DNA nuclease